MSMRIRPSLLKRAGVWLAALTVSPHIGARGGPPVPSVTVLRAPEGSMQPQAVVDPSGTVHVVALTGDPVASDVVYARLEPKQTTFGPAIRVNSEPGSAIARGTIRGAQIALGRDGLVHVAWNGSANARPENPNGGSPMLYARIDPKTKAFEPQRNLMRASLNLDGGGTVAADAKGNVLVAWQALPEGKPPGEVNRRMLVARSKDDGATFSAERPAWATETGACGCCGTRALASGAAFYLMYRGASPGQDRDFFLLTSRDGAQFSGVDLSPWKVNMCPMSTASLTSAADRVYAAWETQGHVEFAAIDPETGRAGKPIRPRGAGGNRKHPSLAVAGDGRVLMAWDEDTSFMRGGSLAWRIFDPSGKSTKDAGRVENGIPRDGLSAAVARPDGSFLIIY